MTSNPIHSAPVTRVLLLLLPNPLKGWRWVGPRTWEQGRNCLFGSDVEEAHLVQEEQRKQGEAGKKRGGKETRVKDTKPPGDIVAKVG